MYFCLDDGSPTEASLNKDYGETTSAIPKAPIDNNDNSWWPFSNSADKGILHINLVWPIYIFYKFNSSRT